METYKTRINFKRNFKRSLLSFSIFLALGNYAYAETITCDESTCNKTNINAKSSIGSNTPTGNIINISKDGYEDVYGGFSENDSVTNNTINITKGTSGWNGNIYGGFSKNNNVSNNKVNITGKDNTAIKLTEIYGGYSDTGKVFGNIVILDADTIPYPEKIVGGESKEGIAENNTITIKAPFIGASYVNLIGSLDNRQGEVISGVMKQPNRNSTLNIQAVGIKVKGVRNFNNYNFFIPTSTENGATLLNVVNSVDMTDSKIGVAIQGENSDFITDDYSVKLIESQGTLKTDENLTDSKEKITVESGMLEYDFLLAQEGNALVAKYNANAQVKNPNTSGNQNTDTSQNPSTDSNTDNTNQTSTDTTATGGSDTTTTSPTTGGSDTTTTTPTTGGSGTSTTSPTTGGSDTTTTTPTTGGSDTTTTTPTTGGSDTSTTSTTTAGSGISTTSPTTGGATNSGNASNQGQGATNTTPTTPPKPRANPRTTSFLATSLANLEFINRGVDLVDNLLSNNFIDQQCYNHHKGQNLDCGLKPFAAISAGSWRYQDDRDTDIKGTNMLVGFGGAAYNTAYGVFAEFGTGKYDDEKLKGSKVKSDGDTKYYGIGAMFRRDFNQAYVKGSVHLGQSETEYNSDNSVLIDGSRHLSFDTKHLYTALTLGAGYQFDINENFALTPFVNMVYLHTDSDKLKIKERDVKLFATDSLRTQAGLKLSYQVEQQANTYVSVALETEHKGKAKGTVLDRDIPTDSIKGTSTVIDSGVKFLLSENLNMTTGVKGSFGYRKGVSGNLSINYKF